MVINEHQNALRIIKTGYVQRQVFRHWTEHNRDPVYEALGFDTETTGVTFGVPSILHYGNTDVKVNNVTAFGISLAIPYRNRMALVWGRLGTPLFDECAKLLAVKGPKVAHNSRYDMRVCKTNNIKLRGPVHCTLTEARIHWNSRMQFGLKELTPTVCPELTGYDEVLKRMLTNYKSSYTRSGYPKGYVNYSFLPDEDIREYAMTDSFLCWMLNMILMPKMIEIHKNVYRRERKIIGIVMNIEERGLPFDRINARKEIAALDRKEAVINKRLLRMAGKPFKPLSPKQLLPILLDMGISKKLLTKRVKGENKLTTEKKTLEEASLKIDSEKTKKFIKTILQLRSYHKLNNTYMKPLYIKASYNNGIVYGNINPTDTRTGRMAHSGPNLGNIPRPKTGFEKTNPVRRCFVCRHGFENFFADYSQMEMWVFALSAGEKKMLGNLQGGLDIHAQTAIDVIGNEAFLSDGVMDPLKRHHFKQVNFAIIYGMGFKALAVMLDVTEMEAHDMRRDYLATYPRIVEYMAELKHQLIAQGYVEDMFGRRYNIDPRKAYKAVNAIVQGSCAQILKIALIKISKYFKTLESYNGLDASVILLIHDEIMYELAKSMPYFMKKEIIKKVEYLMGDIPQLIKRGIRLKVDTKHSITSWEAKREFKGRRIIRKAA